MAPHPAPLWHVASPQGHGRAAACGPTPCTPLARGQPPKAWEGCRMWPHTLYPKCMRPARSAAPNGTGWRAAAGAGADAPTMQGHRRQAGGQPLVLAKMLLPWASPQGTSALHGEQHCRCCLNPTWQQLPLLPRPCVAAIAAAAPTLRSRHRCCYPDPAYRHCCCCCCPNPA